MLGHNERKLSSYSRWILFCVSVAALAGDNHVNVHPRLKRPAVQSHTDIRVDSSLVLLPVSVADGLNRPVTDLQKKDFRVFEGSLEHQVLHLTFEDGPMAVGVVFDTSRSMVKKMEKARAAVAQFFQTANPEDEFFLVEFNNRARIACGLTSEPSEIQTQLASIKPTGQTALLDAVAMAMRELKKSEKPRKALVIFSDGGDNRSRYSKSEVLNMVAESDVMTYAIGILEGNAGRLTPEEIAGPDLLSQLADRTGGRMFPAYNLKDLPEIAGRIGAELHSRYVLGFVPANLQRDGKYHKVRVKVEQPEGMPALRVDYRSGYRAPVQ